MRCQEFQEMMDSYLSDELLVETNHEVLHHLENCPACRNELAARRSLLAQMRVAVKGAKDAQLNSAFERRLKNGLRETALRPPVWTRLKNGIFANTSIFAASAVACLLFIATLGAVWVYRSTSSAENVAAIQENPKSETIEISRPNESPASQAVQITLRETMQTAVGDHKNCAVHFRLTEEPITLIEAAKKYGRFNKDLEKVVLASLKEVSARKAAGETSTEKTAGKTVGKIELLEAHSCVFQGRRFAHVVLRRGKEIISLLVTDADLSGETISNQTVDNLQVAAFGASRYAVFVVSDLSKEENSQIAATLAPVVRRHIEQAGA